MLKKGLIMIGLGQKKKGLSHGRSIGMVMVVRIFSMSSTMISSMLFLGTHTNEETSTRISIIIYRFNFGGPNGFRGGHPNANHQNQAQGGLNFYYILVIMFVIYTIYPLFESKPNFSLTYSG